MTQTPPLKMTIYRWAGQWGPFKVKIPCGECTLTKDIIEDVIQNELPDIAVETEYLDWLSNWWKPLLKGGWHAPIVMLEDKVISQGVAVNRGVLIEAFIREHVKRVPVEGTHIFGKDSCKYCTQAKDLATKHNLDFTYHDVINSPRHLYEMIDRAKKEIGHKTPVTTPQIWIDGKYIGGARELEAYLEGK